MFSIFKRKEKEENTEESPIVEENSSTLSWFSRLKAGLKRTRENLGNGLSRLILGKKQIDEELFEEIQAQLLMADVGVSATEKMLDHLTQAVSRQQLNNPEALLASLKSQLTALLDPVSQPLTIKPFSETGRTFVILVVGVNGSGKTTTLGKMAHFFKNQGYSVMLAAGDTFRAAAVEQLQAWGNRNDVPVVAQSTGADSASVVYDALSSAQAKKIDILLADTAGRLHTQSHLMRELQKIVRVIKKLDPEAPQETLLVLDSGIGQNALNQVEQFHQAMQLTGITITKLDGTAKGGIIFAVAEKNHIPVRFIGVGESIDDLKPFSGKEFVSALFEEE